MTRGESRAGKLRMAQERYINPLADFGLKKLCGEGLNKDLQIDILNELHQGKELLIVDLQ